MKISILGTNGFLSKAIAKYANNAGWTLDLYGLDEPVGHTFNNFYKVNLMDVELDYTGLLDSDMIIYAIGAGIQANLMEGLNLIYNLNVTVPVSICNKLKEFNYQGRIVTFGSVFEIGETMEERFFTEQDVLSSTYPAPNDYTVSKRMLSSFVSSYKHEFTHWHFIIPTIYGAGENPKRLIPYVINAIRNGEEVHFSTGEQTRQYIHVNEVPRLLAMSFEKYLPSGVYNIQGNETVTVKDIVSMIYHAMSKKAPLDCFGTIHRTDVSMKYLALDGTKLKSATGFNAIINIADVLDTY